MPGDLVNSADTESKHLAYRWLARIDADGETDPRSAMNLALSLRPDAVFLLSDGDYPAGCVESVALKNKTKIPVHCIDLAPGAVGDDLKRIATQSGRSVRGPAVERRGLTGALLPADTDPDGLPADRSPVGQEAERRRGSHARAAGREPGDTGRIRRDRPRG